MPASRRLPVLAAALGIAVYSVMDTAMKRLAIDRGAAAAVLWRSWAGVLVLGVPFAWRRRWPGRAALRLHALRGALAGASVLLFFYGLARVPMAQGVAITFLAPLIAILLAAAALGERVRREGLAGAAVAAAGVLVIAGGLARGQAAPGAAAGTLAILAASLLYAGSLVLLRRQAQVADPLEVAFFASLVIGLLLLPCLPWTGWPGPGEWPLVAGAAVLGSGSALLLAWAYARAEAQVIAPTEYTAFVWAALLGRAVFGERLGGWTVAGALLIVAGCAAAVRGRPAPAGPLTEAGA